MPLHDWTRVPACAYRDFHMGFLVAIRRVLNGGVLPEGYAAYVGQSSHVAVRRSGREHVVAVVELVVPANKTTEPALREFVKKITTAVGTSIHALVIDPFPPGKHDPNGIHSAIWDAVTGNQFTPPKDKPLTLAAYSSGKEIVAYVDPLAAGDPLPDMPLFLEPDEYVYVPLERAYQIAYDDVLPQDRAKLDAPAA